MFDSGFGGIQPISQGHTKNSSSYGGLGQTASSSSPANHSSSVKTSAPIKSVSSSQYFDSSNDNNNSYSKKMSDTEKLKSLSGKSAVSSSDLWDDHATVSGGAAGGAYNSNNYGNGGSFDMSGLGDQVQDISDAARAATTRLGSLASDALASAMDKFNQY